MPGTTRGRYRPGSATRTSSTLCVIPSWLLIGLRTSGADRSAFEPAFAAMHGPDLLYLARDPWPWGSPHEAARVHHPARRRGCMDDCGERAAARTDAAHPQQRERMRCIGVLMSLASDDAAGQARIGAFLQGLQQSNWTIGSNVSIETRWAAGDAERIRKAVAELVALAPEVILASGSAIGGPLLQSTPTIPIVFVLVPDPVGAGYVDSLPPPARNATA